MNAHDRTLALLPGFVDPVHDAQTGFRVILAAMAEPGTVHSMPASVIAPAPLEPATAAVILTLADLETPLWLDVDASGEAELARLHVYLRFHCSSPITTEPSKASFAIVTKPTLLRLQDFAQGCMEYPDQSTTLLVQVGSLSQGVQRRLYGPGIRGQRLLLVDGLGPDFDTGWRVSHAGFPLGVDLILCCGNQIIALPRTTQIAI